MGDAATRGNRVLSGTFTIGGASAQIALPLLNENEVSAFLKVKDAIAIELDCTKLKLASGEQAPVFNTRREGGPRKECIDDYISFMPKSEIVATEAIMTGVADIQGLALVSFLGLRGQGTFFAGGVDEIYNWAQKRNCNSNA